MVYRCGRSSGENVVVGDFFTWLSLAGGSHLHRCFCGRAGGMRTHNKRRISQQCREAKNCTGNHYIDNRLFEGLLCDRDEFGHAGMHCASSECA